MLVACRVDTGGGAGDSARVIKSARHQKMTYLTGGLRWATMVLNALPPAWRGDPKSLPFAPSDHRSAASHRERLPGKVYCYGWDRWLLDNLIVSSADCIILRAVVQAA